MKTVPSALLFDMDGVLVRSEDIWFRVVEEAGVRYRGRVITREEFDPTFGQGTEADITQFGLSCSVAELNRFYAENFGRYVDQVWVDPEARPLLERLSREGLRLAVVTNTTTPLAEDILRAAGLRGFFQTVACADQVPRPKPYPDLVLHALSGLGARAGEAWMIGDSRYDREAARDAGVHFIGLRQHGDARVDRLADLARLVS
jgi:phosphoglycolate phosphatase/AHBA synthesis associated protein